MSESVMSNDVETSLIVDLGGVRDVSTSLDMAETEITPPWLPGA
jgi:hypothetical protein